MGILQFLGIKKAVVYPKNTIGFDLANINRNKYKDYLENLRYAQLRKEFSEKIYKFNNIKLFHLANAEKVIREYKSLEKEIWGK